MKRAASKSKHAEDLMNFLDNSAKDTKRAIIEEARQFGVPVDNRLPRDILTDIRRAKLNAG